MIFDFKVNFEFANKGKGEADLSIEMSVTEAIEFAKTGSVEMQTLYSFFKDQEKAERDDRYNDLHDRERTVESRYSEVRKRERDVAARERTMADRESALKELERAE